MAKKKKIKLEHYRVYYREVNQADDTPDKTTNWYIDPKEASLNYMTASELAKSKTFSMDVRVFKVTRVVGPILKFKDLTKKEQTHARWACHGAFSYNRFSKTREKQIEGEKEWRQGKGSIPCWTCREIASKLGLEVG